MASGIKKRSSSDYSDGRPGRINYHSEDEYRTITLLVQSTAYDMQDVAHLRDAINELFDGELLLREMRIKSVEVEYESPGQRTGELHLEVPEYVNGKQLKVAMVNSPEIDDTTLVSTFTVEFETTELPYFETIYTTLELHDSGYSATAEKYGLVDNIDVEKVKYRFSPDIETRYLSNITFDYGLISGTGAISASQAYTYSTNFIKLTPRVEYTFIDKGDNPRLSYWWFAVYNDNGTFIERFSSNGNPNPRIHKFVAKGSNLRIMTNAVTPLADNVIRPEEIGVDVLPTISGQAEKTTFNVYNAGNVAIEPESMELRIRFRNARNLGEIKLVNKTTGETFSTTADVGLTRHFEINGMVVKSGAKNIFRDTNRRFIRLAPGINELEFSGATFDSLDFNFKYLYK